MKRILALVVCFLLLGVTLTHAQTAARPLILPMAEPAGASTWLLGQPYGNTTGAYNFGQQWYRAGQGLHFGMDFSMPCGTPLVAVADGEVMFVDNLSFGSGPHNLLIRHPNAGVISLYGHLLETPNLLPGQFVQQGQEVALSGDPDVTCISRPHLHFELRSLEYTTAYNPVDYIDAPWHMLSSIGSYSGRSFQRDLFNPRRWLSVDDQPPVQFGGVRLNEYSAAEPPGNGRQAPPNPPIARPILPLPDDFSYTARRLTFEGCCAYPRWHPFDPDRVLVVDGSPGQRAAVIEWSVTTGEPAGVVGEAPIPNYSPDGTYQVMDYGSQVYLRQLSDGTEIFAPTGGNLPAISTDNSQIMWTTQQGEWTPGQARPPVTVWLADINGENGRILLSERGIAARWLDGSRLLITRDVEELRADEYAVYDIRDDSRYTLGTFSEARALSIAPGGGRIMFYRRNTGNPAEDGVFVMDTVPGAQPLKLSWFGGWRWRDADSVYYVPFDPTTEQQTLMLYHLLTGETRTLTDIPFTIANGDWSVSPDGQRIIFRNANDMTTWVLEPGTE